MASKTERSNMSGPPGSDEERYYPSDRWIIRALKRRLGDDASPEGLSTVLQDGCSGRAGPSGHGYTEPEPPQSDLERVALVARAFLFFSSTSPSMVKLLV